MVKSEAALLLSRRQTPVNKLNNVVERTPVSLVLHTEILSTPDWINLIDHSNTETNR
jgi:hypothetical protein